MTTENPEPEPTAEDVSHATQYEKLRGQNVFAAAAYIAQHEPSITRGLRALNELEADLAATPEPRPEVEQAAIAAHSAEQRKARVLIRSEHARLRLVNPFAAAQIGLRHPHIVFRDPLDDDDDLPPQAA